METTEHSPFLAFLGIFIADILMIGLLYFSICKLFSLEFIFSDIFLWWTSYFSLRYLVTHMFGFLRKN